MCSIYILYRISTWGTGAEAMLHTFKRAVGHIFFFPKRVLLNIFLSNIYVCQLPERNNLAPTFLLATSMKYNYYDINNWA